MAGLFSSIGEKLGKTGDDKIKFLMAGTLVLVIGFSLYFALGNSLGGGKSKRSEVRYYDLETQEEGLQFSPEEFSKANQSEDGAPYLMPLEPRIVRSVNPKTGKRTLVQMKKCLKCEEFFIEDYLKGENPPSSMDIKPPVCTKCGTNLREYKIEQIKKQKK